MPAGDQEAACRLYLLSPEAFAPAEFARLLAAALDAGDVACFQLALAHDDDDVWRAAAEAVVPVCRDRGTAVLLHGHAHLVAETGADGIHVQGPVTGLRESLPADAILGAGCGLSRHDAMIAGEAGADYVSFGPWGPEASELLSWWQEVMELPCVAAGGLALDNVALAAASGADFVALRSAVWGHDAGPAAAVREAAESVDKARTR